MSAISGREPVLLDVTLKYASAESFEAGFAPNLSAQAVFLKTKSPKPVGTPVRVQLHLRDGSLVLAGEGRVQWSYPGDAVPPGRQAGMGIVFAPDDGESRDRVQRMLERSGQGPMAAVPGSRLAVLGLAAAVHVVSPPREASAGAPPRAPRPRRAVAAEPDLTSALGDAFAAITTEDAIPRPTPAGIAPANPGGPPPLPAARRRVVPRPAEPEWVDDADIEMLEAVDGAPAAAATAGATRPGPSTLAATTEQAPTAALPASPPPPSELPPTGAAETAVVREHAAGAGPGAAAPSDVGVEPPIPGEPAAAGVAVTRSDTAEPELEVAPAPAIEPVTTPPGGEPRAAADTASIAEGTPGELVQDRELALAAVVDAEVGALAGELVDASIPTAHHLPEDQEPGEAVAAVASAAASAAAVAQVLSAEVTSSPVTSADVEEPEPGEASGAALAPASSIGETAPGADGIPPPLRAQERLAAGLSPDIVGLRGGETDPEQLHGRATLGLAGLGVAPPALAGWYWIVGGSLAEPFAPQPLEWPAEGTKRPVSKIPPLLDDEVWTKLTGDAPAPVDWTSRLQEASPALVEAGESLPLPLKSLAVEALSGTASAAPAAATVRPEPLEPESDVFAASDGAVGALEQLESSPRELAPAREVPVDDGEYLSWGDEVFTLGDRSDAATTAPAAGRAPYQAPRIRSRDASALASDELGVERTQPGVPSPLDRDGVEPAGVAASSSLPWEPDADDDKGSDADLGVSSTDDTTPGVRSPFADESVEVPAADTAAAPVAAAPSPFATLLAESAPAAREVAADTAPAPDDFAGFDVSSDVITTRPAAPPRPQAPAPEAATAEEPASTPARSGVLGKLRRLFGSGS